MAAKKQTVTLAEVAGAIVELQKRVGFVQGDVDKLRDVVKNGFATMATMAAGTASALEGVKERLPPPQPPKQKLCIRCAHCRLADHRDPEAQKHYAKCAVVRDVVSGAPDNYCSTARASYGHCGEAGKYWTPLPESARAQPNRRWWRRA